jgi:hypothetical protein
MQKFKFNEEVRVRLTNKTGVVTGYRKDVLINKGETSTVRFYRIDVGLHSHWLKEDELEYVYTFTNNFEKGIINLLIDINLSARNFDQVKHFHDLKQQYKG